MDYESKSVEVTFEDGSKGDMELKFPIKEKKKVYIVGCANSKNVLSWDDPDAEYWGVNNLYGVPIEGAHYDRWFEIHNIWQDPKTDKMLRRNMNEFRGQDVLNYMQGLASLKCTVYMQKHWPNLIPYSIPYPLDEVVQFFQNKGINLDVCRYITNTIAYEIMLAIYLGFEEIHVWGVDMSVGSEYEHQKACCEFWMGVALGMGIRVYVPSQADLLKTRFLYGFEEKQSDEWNEKLEKIRVDAKVKRLQLEHQHSEDAKTIEQYRGVEKATEEIKMIWANLSDDLMYYKRGTL